MKIVEHTPDRLVVAERPWLFAALLIALFAGVLIGGAQEWPRAGWGVRAILVFWTVALPLGFYYFVHFVRAEFDRLSGRVTVSRRGVFYDRSETHSLAHFRHARVDETHNEGTAYRLVLAFAEAVLDEMDPAVRARRERRRRRGLRQTAPNDIPLTAYYSGITNAKAVAETINQWAK